jgi:hypothetical protein
LHIDLSVVVAPLDLVFARLANEPGFADTLRNDPATALRGLDLSLDDLRRLEQFLVERIDLSSLLGADGRNVGPDC